MAIFAELNEETAKRSVELLSISEQSHVYEYRPDEVQHILAEAGFKVIASCSEIRIEYICVKEE